MDYLQTRLPTSTASGEGGAGAARSGGAGAGSAAAGRTQPFLLSRLNCSTGVGRGSASGPPPSTEIVVRRETLNLSTALTTVGLIISGGNPNEDSLYKGVEVWSEATNRLCLGPPLPFEARGHTTGGTILLSTC